MKYKKVTCRKIIFLDIDGVLNCARNNVAYGNNQRSLDPIGIKMLNRLCDETGAKICVSSVWRHHDYCQTVLNHCGLNFNNFVSFFVGSTAFNRGSYYDDVWRTPCLKGIHRKRCEGKIRGEEIKLWLKSYGKKLGVQKYVIIDDDSDFYKYQKKFFVHTDSFEGFLYRDYKLALKILGCKNGKI